MNKINHLLCLYALILLGSPTAFSIREYHSPIRVCSTISLPDFKYRMGLRTPKTSRSARLGFKPPVKKKYNRPVNGSHQRKISHCNKLECRARSPLMKKETLTKILATFQSIHPCLCSTIQGCTFISNVMSLLQLLWHKVHCCSTSILGYQPLREAEIAWIWWKHHKRESVS